MQRHKSSIVSGDVFRVTRLKLPPRRLASRRLATMCLRTIILFIVFFFSPPPPPLSLSLVFARSARFVNSDAAARTGVCVLTRGREYGEGDGPGGPLFLLLHHHSAMQA